ncbi:Trafficking protein particle complex subunit 4, partial [Perkinsus olseni]
DLAIRGHIDRDANFWRLLDFAAKDCSVLSDAYSYWEMASEKNSSVGSEALGPRTLAGPSSLGMFLEVALPEKSHFGAYELECIHILALSNLIPPPPPAYGRRTKGHYELLEQVMEERQKAHQAAIEVFNKLGRQQKVVFTTVALLSKRTAEGVSAQCLAAWTEMTDSYEFKFWYERERQLCFIKLQNSVASCCGEVDYSDHRFEDCDRSCELDCRYGGEWERVCSRSF